MNRNDIVAVARANSALGQTFSRRVVRDALDFTIAEITAELLRGGDVKLAGFGTFEVKERKDRIGRNPKTGEPIAIKSHKAVVFRPARHFWDKK